MGERLTKASPGADDRGMVDVPFLALVLLRQKDLWKRPAEKNT